MKNLILVITFIFALSNIAPAQSAGDQPSKTVLKPKLSNLSVSLRAGKLIFNKIEVSKEWKVAPIIKNFGSEGRKRDGVNITHSYDNDGIVLFEKTNDKKSTGELLEFQVYLSETESNNVSPTGFYGGTLLIEGKTIAYDLTLGDLRRLLKDYTESDSYMPHNYRFAFKGIYMYVQYDDDDLEIKKFSFGKDKKGAINNN